MNTPGIHHITALAGEPRRNLDFYVGTLGLRLVKLTVNFDDPGTYHLYFGTEEGAPGTVLTFFPWPNVPPGRPGVGQVTATAFSVPSGSIDAWSARLRDAGTDVGAPIERFDAPALEFADPDGLRVELIESPDDDRSPWPGGTIDPEHAIRGFHSATLRLDRIENTAELLDAMGFDRVARDDRRIRMTAGAKGPGGTVDLVRGPPGQRGRVAVGTVHHIAWRAPDEDAQLAWREELLSRGLDVTPVLDRRYFRSIYFREPGGVLFEIATDGPGFGIDEPTDRLGRELKLPPWLEPRRAEIEDRLPPLE